MITPPRKNRLLVPAIMLSLALSLSACVGSDNNTTAAPTKTNIACAAGSVQGAGSTFVLNIAQQWVKDYTGSCPQTTVNYQGVGSGAGIQQLTAGTVDFAASDVPLTASEQAALTAKYGGVLQIPWSAGAIAVEYKLSGVPSLELSAATLAGIFAGKITKWDDSSIKADNANTNLPSTPLQVVHRSDGSGTTAAFTAYLAANAPTIWTAGSGKDVAWPTGQGAKGSDGVTGAVKATEGAIGYAELSFAKGNALPTAKIKNQAGRAVGPDQNNGVTAALAEAQLSDNQPVKIDYTPTEPEAYPISTVTYVIVPQRPADSAKANVIRSFIAYALGDGQSEAGALHYAALPSSIADPAKIASAKIETGAAN